MSSLKKKNERKKKEKLKIKGNKKYRESKERQQAPFHSFGFSDMISTWGQRHPKQDKRVNTERRHSQQGKQENTKPQKLFMDESGETAREEGTLERRASNWCRKQNTGKTAGLKARLKLWMNVEMKGGRLILLKKVKG